MPPTGYKPIFRGGPPPEAPASGIASLPPPPAPWVRPRGKPPALVKVLPEVVPWLLERIGDGGPSQPFQQAGEARPTHWVEADKLRLAYDMAGRLGARCRRLAQQGGVTLMAAAKHIAEATFSDAERCKAPGHERIPPPGTAERKGQRDRLAKAIASMARPDREPAAAAATTMGTTKTGRHTLTDAQTAARNALRAAALQATKDALAAMVTPAPLLTQRPGDPGQ